MGTILAEPYSTAFGVEQSKSIYLDPISFISGYSDFIMNGLPFERALEF